MKKEKKKSRTKEIKKSKKKSIRTKMMILPISLVILSTLSLIISVSYQTNRSMHEQMEEHSTFLLENVVSRLNDNERSIESIEGIVDNELMESLEVIQNRDTENLDQEEFTDLANLLKVDELNLYNQEGEIIQSNILTNRNKKVDSDNPLMTFINSDEEIMLEEPREDQTGYLIGLYKYGAIKNDDGTVFRLGEPADELISMTEDFEMGNVINDLMSSELITYAGFIDSDYTYLANNNKDFIGQDMSDSPEFIEAMTEEELTIKDRTTDQGEVLDMIYPVKINGILRGAFRIGFNVAPVNNAVVSSVMNIVIIKLITIGLLIFVLIKSARDIIHNVKVIQKDMEEMAEGDFSTDLTDEMMNRKDEFGEIANADMRMKESIRGILENVSQRAELLAAHSEELTATANQSVVSANELTTVIEEIANSSSTQAHDVENGATAVQELDRVMQVNDQNMNRLNKSTDEVNSLKDEGLELIRDLVDKTEETRQSIQEISEVITETNTSADNIVKALEMIKNISDQTNLLALNASIEAARAGEAGAGFAVVAEEIRKLAEDSSNFTGEIEHIVKDLTSKTETAVDTMELVDTNIDSQGDSVKRTDLKFQGISGAVEEIHGAITKVNGSNEDLEQQKERLAGLIENLAAVAEENAAGSEEASASVEEQNSVMAEISNASEELAETAEILNNAVSVFKI